MWHQVGRTTASGEALASWRRQIIVVVFAAEALACLNRRNLSVASTVWASRANDINNTAKFSAGGDAAEDVRLDDEQIGELATAAALAYAVSKPLQSLLSDSVSSRRQLSVGLLGTGLCNILIGLSSSHRSFMLLMMVNGLLQGGVFPAIARLILLWYPEATRCVFLPRQHLGVILLFATAVLAAFFFIVRLNLPNLLALI